MEELKSKTLEENIKKLILLSIALIIAMVALISSASAVAPNPNYGSGIDVDGDYADWNLKEDYFADMYRAGNPTKVVESKLYLRYDCSESVMYALILAEDRAQILGKSKDTWIAINSVNNKVLRGIDVDDGNPPDFAWVYDGDKLIGCEGSFRIDEGDYKILAQTEVSATHREKEKPALDLTISCPTVNPSLKVKKSISDVYYLNGDTINYIYNVTNDGDVAFVDVAVSDVFSAPYHGPSITVTGPVSGDTDSNGEIDPGETWRYEGTAIAPGFNGLFTLDNTVTATGTYNGNEYSSTDTYKLYPFTLRKEVFLYWDDSSYTKTYFDATGIADDTNFDVKIMKGEDEIGAIQISRSSPAYMWLSEGSYKFLESELPSGYMVGYENGISYTTGEGNPDWTFPNIIGYDLYLNKTGPEHIFVDDTSVTYCIIVGNNGPASLKMPIITDKDATVEFVYEGEYVKYVKGDANKNNLLDPGETWYAKAITTLSELVPDAYITNTACVKDSDLPDTSEWFLGGDLDPSNNCDTATVYVWWKGYTPGYWKNHPMAWGTQYTPSTGVNTVFGLQSNSDTLMTALGYKGGSDTEGATRILLRAAVAALLNEDKFGNGYPPYATTGDLIGAVNEALESNDRATMITLANTLDKWNNGYHP